MNPDMRFPLYACSCCWRLAELHNALGSFRANYLSHCDSCHNLIFKDFERGEVANLMLNGRVYSLNIESSMRCVPNNYMRRKLFSNGKYRAWNSPPGEHGRRYKHIKFLTDV